MAIIDWIIVGLYLLITVGIGIYFARTASRSTTDYFVAGRRLHWFVAGTSIVATTFSSDTPLVVAGISRQTGIYGHWFWLSAAIGQVATVFFFARLWRRTEVMTDIEFVVRRYPPCKARSALRIFKVFFDGILLNCTVMASVTLAMVKIIKVLVSFPDNSVLDLPLFGAITWPTILMLCLGVTAVLYSTLSGLYGVVYTDLIQFALAMIGSISLAVVVYIDAGGSNGLMEKLMAAPDFNLSFLDFFPNMNRSALITFTFFVYIFMTWWHRAPGNGYYVQRLLATKSEKDSFFAFLWFNICQYVIRPWPWIIVGLLSLYYIPAMDDPENSFPMMINLFMPVGLKGIMVAAMLAAFMSTIDTHLNWGTSYLINDFYRPFISDYKSTRHYIFVARIGLILLTIIALIITTKLSSVLGAYKYLGVMYGGIGTVMIARWYWWRVNPYSEISAIITSLIAANLLQLMLPSTSNVDLFPVRVVITIILVTVVWVTVTFLTSKETPNKHTIAFYSKMRISGPGWKRVGKLAGVKPYAGEFKWSLVGWLTCVAFLFSIVLGIGKFIFHLWLPGLIYIGIAIVTGYILKKIIAKIRFL